MSEINTPRLMAAAKEFNIGTSTLTDFLVSKGFETSDLKPTSKISEDMYRVLQVEFQPDKVAKQKAEQIDLPKNAPADNKKRRDEQDLSFNKKETAKEKEEKVHAVEEPVPVKEKEKEVIIVEKENKPNEISETVVEVKEKVEKENVVVPEKVAESTQTELTKINAPEVEGLKIIDKIDLSSIDSSVRPKKDSKKKEVKSKVKGAITEENNDVEKTLPEEKVVEVEGPVAAPEKDVPAIITNIKAAKLEGPKIMGKIDLPVHNDTRPKPSNEKRKRKRIIVEKKPAPGNHPPRPNIQRPNGNNRPAPGGRFNNRNTPATRREEKEIDQKEIQDKIKETQAKLAGSGGRGKSLKAKYRKQKRE